MIQADVWVKTSMMMNQWHLLTDVRRNIELDTLWSTYHELQVSVVKFTALTAEGLSFVFYLVISSFKWSAQTCFLIY